MQPKTVLVISDGEDKEVKLIFSAWLMSLPATSCVPLLVLPS
jgi:hypothetical protein